MAAAAPDDGRASRLTVTGAGPAPSEGVLRARRGRLAGLTGARPEGDRQDLARLVRRFAPTIERDVGARHGR